MHVQPLRAARRRCTRPQLLNQLIARHDLVRPQQQQSKHGSRHPPPSPAPPPPPAPAPPPPPPPAPPPPPPPATPPPPRQSRSCAGSAAVFRSRVSAVAWNPARIRPEITSEQAACPCVRRLADGPVGARHRSSSWDRDQLFRLWTDRSLRDHLPAPGSRLPDGDCGARAGGGYGRRGGCATPPRV